MYGITLYCRLTLRIEQVIWLPDKVSENSTTEVQTVQTLIRCHILWHLIWVYTVYSGISVHMFGKYSN